jgi:hypothetical protein
MPPAIVTSKTRQRYELPPQGPYILNAGSEFAVGLVGWWPLGDWSPVAATDYSGKATPLNVPVNGTFGRGTTGVGGFGYSNSGSTANYLCHTTQAALNAYPYTINAWFKVRTSAEFGAESCLASVALTSKAFSTFGEYVTLAYDGANGEGLGAHKVILDPAGGSSVECATSTAVAGAGDAPLMATGVGTSATARAVYLNAGGKGTNATSVVPTGNWASTSVGCLRQVGGTPATFSPMNGLLWNVTMHAVALTDAQVARLCDPRWRWDLYYQPGRVAYSFQAPAAGGFKAAWAAGSNGIIGTGVF